MKALKLLATIMAKKNATYQSTSLHTLVFKAPYRNIFQQFGGPPSSTMVLTQIIQVSFIGDCAPKFDLTINEWWLATKLCFSFCVTFWNGSCSRASYNENNAVSGGLNYTPRGGDPCDFTNLESRNLLALSHKKSGYKLYINKDRRDTYKQNIKINKLTQIKTLTD